ncbi:hypothetical protein I8752_26515 [Nostocaceae cyanobacterium CENA369]|uniref:Uncharacterized protein n=1 Tax=Dendronalium phyllosphericum CENA369 TaxID=1725256 RepID=A0A8J7I685_9NOST|nr:hypothetical protein [Dendronalium phyllosphericum]MBH8576479.1 hypothetical protein [Dendronalium phyllosphericum CENA369]
MLTITWQEEIASLKQNLTNEINKISRNSEFNIPNYICINNLKAKLERLDEIEKILSIEKYKIAFIGTIGQGKTTAICHLFNLISEFKVSKTIASKTKDVVETKELLSTGAGKTTICEVIIKAGEKTYIEIEPYPVDEMENLIFEFCDYIADKDKDNTQLDQKIIISKELERAIRNVVDMKLRYKTISDGDKKKNEIIDTAKEEFDKVGLDGFKKLALNNAKLESRTTNKIEFDNQNNEQAWIKNTFAAINNVEFKEFAIPRKIYLYVSYDVLSGSNLSQFDSIIDTKGLDVNPIRKDLQKYIENQDTICLFVTPFNDAPEANIRTLIGYHLTSKSKDFHHRFVTLVLPKKNEPEKVHECDGNYDIGIQVRKEEIQDTFKKLNLDFFLENILFYDALRYYRDDIVKLNEIYEKEDIQADKNQFLQAITDVIERRRNILLEEIKDIKESFTKIKNGDALTEAEIKAIENAIHKIKDLRYLNKRVQSFLYQDKGQDKGFVTKYVEYYRTVYKAWNTKHAIHRNFGYYEPRNIDIYYDMRVIAEGLNEDEMLKKFTKEPKRELECILNDLTSINESLKTLIPELFIQFNSFYDNFISEVGVEIQYEAIRKLSPQSEDSEFWKALINEKGKVQLPGENYTGNVCLTFKNELESEQSLNTFLEIKAGQYWAELVTKILSFFGEE